MTRESDDASPLSDRVFRRGVKRPLLAVRTRHGALVHLPNPMHRVKTRSTTLCGVEWIGFNYGDASMDAVTCSRCKALLARYEQQVETDRALLAEPEPAS